MSIIKFKNEEDLNQAGLVIDSETGDAITALAAMTRAVNCRCVKVKKMLGVVQLELVETGKELIGIRAYIQERRIAGGFDGWVRRDFEWSRTQAYRLIAIAEKFADCPNLGHYDQSAMGLLAAPGTPIAAREEAKQLAENGEFVDYTTAAELIRQHRAVLENEAVETTAPEAIEFGQPANEAISLSEEAPEFGSKAADESDEAEEVGETGGSRVAKARKTNPYLVVPRELSAWESHVIERAKQFQVKGQVDCLVAFLESFGVQPSL